MAKRRMQTRKRRYRRYSDRRLSGSELTALEFLWTWKVATSPMLGLVAFKGRSNWWVYKALRRLKEEKYIQLLPRGRNLSQELWALTDLGFEVVLMDRDDIFAHRYKPHAPTHDFLATALQLGDLWLSNLQPQFFTEQMLASLASSNFPKGFKKVKEHIPDGVTLIQGKVRKAIIGYEVDINLKAEERYENTFAYYERGVYPDVIVWLVRNTWMARRILAIYNENCKNSYTEDLTPKIAFVLMDDFKKKIWGAEIVSPSFNGITVRKLHANLIQSLGKDAAKLGQRNLVPIFFPKHKSPQKTMLYLKEV